LIVEKGELRAVIGPNGSGKTTLLNVISGFYKGDSGKIYLENEEISNLKAHQITRRGIARTFQKSEIFSEMTVIENIMVGKHLTLRAGLISSALRARKVRLEEERIRKESYEILELLGLAKYRDYISSGLPFGLRRLMEIGRAIATNPKVLLLDEPAAGMNVEEVGKLHKLILQIRARDITILMIEHNMKLVMEIADRISVLHYGEKIAEGCATEIKNNPKVIEAYLGSRE
jgi:branched-chain amino acid transport system ATP-binding protein